MILFGLVDNKKLGNLSTNGLFLIRLSQRNLSYSFRYLLSTYYMTCPVLITREPNKFHAFIVYNLLVEIDNKHNIKLNILKKSKVGLQAREH